MRPPVVVVRIGALWLIAAALLASACTRSPRPQTRQMPNSRTGQPPDSTKASLTAHFEKAALSQLGIGTAGLVYKFGYLTVNTTGPIDFRGQDTADILIAPELPVGQKGTITLEVREGNVAKLVGEKQEVTLVAGDNALEIELKPVGSQPSGAKLKLTVKIGAPVPAPTPLPEIPGGIPSDWNGRSFLGNLAWQIDAPAR